MSEHTTRTLNIAFVSQPWEGALPPASSVPIWTYEVARRLARKHQVRVYARRNNQQPPVAYDQGVTYALSYRTLDDWLLRGLNPLSRYFPARRPLYTSWLYYLPYIVAVARDLRRQRCDIVHIQNFSQFVPVVRAFNPLARIVLHMHCDWLPNIDQQLTARRLRSIDMILGTTDYIRDGIRRTYPHLAQRCQTIYNGVDLDMFGASPNQHRPADHPPRLLYVGRVSPEKGVHVLLQAFGELLHHHPDAQLEVVGPLWVASLEFLESLIDADKIHTLQSFYNEQTYQDHLEKLVPAAHRAQVTFTGQVPYRDLVARYRAADIFVFPSIVKEAFGMPVAEAMAVGLPVVASRIGGLAEVVDSGTTGLLSEPGNGSALAKALLFLLQQPAARRAMGEAGHQRAAQLFSWDLIADDLERYYHNVM